MQEQLVTLETAKLAKEKGFDERVEHCHKVYDDGTINYEVNQSHRNSISKYSNILDSFSAPTQSFLQKWFREKHNVEMYMRHWNGSPRVYEYVLHYTDQNKLSHTVFSDHRYDTYEEALEASLQEILKII